MISTVTTSTVSTVTLAGSFAVIGILVLLAFLVQKELTTTGTSKNVKSLRLFLNIGIFPLILVFVAVVISKIADILK
jgi:hypothetical protein